MNTIFSTTTKNYDTISVVRTQDDWYEVYFNNTLISQHISLKIAYEDVENQLSL
mgnify:CR=1 FL=1